MKRVMNLAVAAMALLLLAQCATRDEVRELHYQIRAVNQKVDDVRSSTVDQMQKRQASSVSRIDQMQEELVRLQARIEESGHQDTLFREQLKESVAAIGASLDSVRTESETRIKELEERVQQLEHSLARMSEARIREAEQRAREAARRAEEARKRTVVAAAASGGMVTIKPDGRKVRLDGSKKIEAAVSTGGTGLAATETGTVAPPPAAGGGDLFRRALEQYRAKQYTEAYKTFEQVLAQNPRGDEAAETLFYMGESLYARGEYDLAILDYQKVISNHAGHRRTPTALLKQGMSFEKLTDLETAKIIYNKLITEYPDSAEAEAAKQQLAALQ
ncbi:MAG: hypothetical protein Kow0089_00750 [Desulfobulbaceae bacterium]